MTSSTAAHAVMTVPANPQRYAAATVGKRNSTKNGLDVPCVNQVTTVATPTSTTCVVHPARTDCAGSTRSQARTMNAKIT
jgi:hypothetical protein